MKTKKSMTIFIAMLMFAGSSLMAGCIPIIGEKGNGKVVKQERKVSDFTSLEVSGAFTVYLFQGNSESLTVEADENLMEFIRTEVRGDKLVIDTENKSIQKFTKMNIYLTFEDLEMIDISGAVNIIGEDMMKFDDLSIDGSGASEIKLKLEVEMFRADFSGASEIELVGEAKAAIFDLSGASDIEAYEFVIEHCELDVSGASDARIYVTSNLEVDVSGAASVKYKGSPKVQSDVSGAGSLKSY